MRSTQRDGGDSVVARATSILFSFRAGERPLGVSELARRSGLPKATAARLAGRLVDAGLLERVGVDYQLGIRVFELGELAPRPRDLWRIASGQMLDLQRATGHTVHLAVLDEHEVVYVKVLRSRTGPPLPSRDGGRLPAYATGVGKSLLAFAPENVVNAVIGRGLTPIGPRTIRSEAALRDELATIKRTGIAYEREESAPHVGCAASPIFDADGRAIAAVSVSGWSGRLDVRRVGPAVRTAALGIGRLAARPSA